MPCTHWLLTWQQRHMQVRQRRKLVALLAKAIVHSLAFGLGGHGQLPVAVVANNHIEVPHLPLFLQPQVDNVVVACLAEE